MHHSFRKPPEAIAGGPEQTGRGVGRERPQVGTGFEAGAGHRGGAGLFQGGSAAPKLRGVAAGKGGPD